MVSVGSPARTELGEYAGYPEGLTADDAGGSGAFPVAVIGSPAITDKVPTTKHPTFDVLVGLGDTAGNYIDIDPFASWPVGVLTVQGQALLVNPVKTPRSLVLRPAFRSWSGH